MDCIVVGGPAAGSIIDVPLGTPMIALRRPLPRTNLIAIPGAPEPEQIFEEAQYAIHAIAYPLGVDRPFLLAFAVPPEQTMEWAVRELLAAYQSVCLAQQMAAEQQPTTQVH